METRIRVDNEIRAVREEVRRALFRDSIEIEQWPVATPVDVLIALNDQKPHVMHFSGHGGAGQLEFDDGKVTRLRRVRSVSARADRVGS